MEVEEVSSKIGLFSTYVVKPCLGGGWFLLLFLFLLSIGKYIFTAIMTMRPSFFKRKGISEREARSHYNNALTLYYELD